MRLEVQLDVQQCREALQVPMRRNRPQKTGGCPLILPRLRPAPAPVDLTCTGQASNQAPESVPSTPCRRAWVDWHEQSGCPSGAPPSSSPPSCGGASAQRRAGARQVLCNSGIYTVKYPYFVQYVVKLSDLQLTDRTLEESGTAILGQQLKLAAPVRPDIFSLNDC